MDDISKRSMAISRSFNAPIELVWKLLTTPEHIQNWWGPDGFSNTIRTMDVRNGGIWDFTMHGPDGNDFINFYHYLEVIPNQKIVMEHRNHPKFQIIVLLEEEGNKTKVTWTNVFDSIPTMEDTIKAYNADKGLVENIQRFSNYANALSN